MIYQDDKGRWHSDLLGTPPYCNASWGGEGQENAVDICSAGGSAEVNIDWQDIPNLVSDLLLLYERARLRWASVPVTEACKPNLR
jgi:hypothetical protein